MKRILLWLVSILIVCILGVTALRFGHRTYDRWKFSRDQHQIAQRVTDLSKLDGKLFLLSIDPYHRQGDVNTSTVFHVFPILGMVEIVEKREKEKLFSSLAENIRASDGIVAMCFNPRHGLRKYKDDRFRDLLRMPFRRRL